MTDHNDEEHDMALEHNEHHGPEGHHGEHHEHFRAIPVEESTLYAGTGPIEYFRH